MSVLVPQEEQQLHEILVAGFEVGTLKTVVKYSLGQKLSVILDVNKGFGEVVFEFLGWLDQRGPGAFEAFLRGAVAAQPANIPLQTFCRAHFPEALRPLVAGDLVTKVNQGLTLLIDMIDLPEVRETVGYFRADFSATRSQIINLRKYKALHDSLHELQLEFFTIAMSLNQPQASANLRAIVRHYADLRRWAKKARDQLPGLPGAEVEELWLDEFDACINVIQAATSPNATSTDWTDLSKVSHRLKDILPNAPRINYALANAASALRLESISQTMGLISERLRQQAGDNNLALQQLESSSRAVISLRSRIDGLVGEHYEWQTFDKELEAAANSTRHLPQDRMPRWKAFKERMTELCDTYPKEQWSQELKMLMEKWINETASLEPAENEINAGIIAFDLFHRQSMYRFYEVDKELSNLSEEATGVAQPLEVLLNVIRAPAMSVQ